MIPGGLPRGSPHPTPTPSPYEYKPSSSPSGSSPFPLHFNNPSSPTPLTGSLAFPGEPSNPSSSSSSSLPVGLFMNPASSSSFGGATASSNTSPSPYGGSSIPSYNPNPYSPPENYSSYSNRMYLASCSFSLILESWLKTEQQRIQEEEAKLEAAKIKNLQSQLQQKLTEQYQLLKAEVSSLEQDKSVYGEIFFFSFTTLTFFPFIRLHSLTRNRNQFPFKGRKTKTTNRTSNATTHAYSY